MRTSTNFLAAATFATLALARTDLEGCTSTDVSSPAGASYAWYVPGTGEVCEFLDCGGGRAPPKTTVAGCPGYVGTETYSPSFFPGFQASETAAPSSTTEAESSSITEASSSDAEFVTSSSSFDWNAAETDTAISSWDLYTTLGSETTAVPASSSIASEVEVSSSAAAEITSSASSVASSESSTLVAQTTASNGTVSSGHTGSSSNGTVGNGTASPSAPVSEGGAAKAWVGSAGVVMGLVGLVAVL